MRYLPIRAALAAIVAVAVLLPALCRASDEPAPQAMAGAQAKLAWRLIASASPAEPSRIVSPASLAAALATLALGADAQMKAAILQAMNAPGDGGDVLASVREGLRGADPYLLQSADRVVFAPGQPPSAEAAANLKAANVEYGVLDLSSWSGVREMDGWIAQKTAGVIPKFFDKPLNRPIFAVVNALHFKTKWKVPFDPSQTFPAAFTEVGGAYEDVSLMLLKLGTRAYRSEPNFVGVELPFIGDRFALVVVTSTDKPRPLADFAAVSDWLSAAGFTPQKGDLTLPRFELEGGEDLLPALQNDLAPGLASPTALDGFAHGITIGGVIQRVKIDVNEKGAEAAAVTTIPMVGARRVEDNAIHMRVDKPFLFALRDRTSGLILAAGYIGKAPK